MSKRGLIPAVVCWLLVAASAPAWAHVTVQPNESVAGTFSRFVARVPTERDVPTTEVRIDFPPLAFVSFQPKEGWDRDVEMTTLDEPLDVSGNEITEVVGSVRWSGGRIGVEQETHALAEENPTGNLGTILGAAGVVLGAVALAIVLRVRGSKG